jgi:hypothetical protein
MKQLSIVTQVVTFFNQCNQRERMRAIMFIIAGVCCVLGGIVGYIQIASEDLITQINQLQRLRIANNKILTRYAALQDKELAFNAQMQERKDFSIKTYFERFIKEHNITAEGNWAETEKRAIPGNDLFEEEILKASFKNMTTEKIVGILGDFEKDNFVDVKEASLKLEGSTVTLDLVLAAKRFKKMIEES